MLAGLRPCLLSLPLAFLSGCGARTGLDAPDATAALPDVAPSTSCTLDPTVHQLGPSSAPAFAYAVQARDPDGAAGWLVSSGHGWPPTEIGRIATIGPSLDVTATTTTASSRVFAGWTADGTVSLAMTETNQRVALELLRLSGRTLTTLSTIALCASCTAARSPPVALSERWMFATERAGGTDIHVRARMNLAEVTPPLRLAGVEPHVAISDRGPLWSLRRNDNIALALLDSSARVLGGIDAAFSVPIRSSFAHAVMSTGDIAVFGIRVEPTGRTLLFERVTADFVPTPHVILAPMRGIPTYMNAAAHSGTAAATWGDQSSPGAGAYATVIARDGTVLWPPAIVSTEIANQASHTIWSAIAPHPNGYLVVWGAWEERTMYALYARILRCPAR